MLKILFFLIIFVSNFPLTAMEQSQAVITPLVAEQLQTFEEARKDFAVIRIAMRYYYYDPQIIHTILGSRNLHFSKDQIHPTLQQRLETMKNLRASLPKGLLNKIEEELDDYAREEKDKWEEIYPLIR
jgi:hypothetical protein